MPRRSARSAAIAVAAGALLLPLPWSVRACLVVAATANGALHAARRRTSRQLAARSFTDRLTGLRNYDFFSQALRDELARVRRYGGCVTLVILDLDRFKAYNDRHGHAAGNRLLNAVGQAITREKRDADIAARFGGEEFAVLVPGTTGDGVILAERMRQAIADLTPSPTSRSDFAPGDLGQCRSRDLPGRRPRPQGAVRTGRPGALRGKAARPRPGRHRRGADRAAASARALRSARAKRGGVEAGRPQLGVERSTVRSRRSPNGRSISRTVRSW